PERLSACVPDGPSFRITVDGTPVYCADLGLTEDQRVLKEGA
ncbi:hypothetical protein J2Z78_006882, partial [Streptomyces griseorubens]